MKHLLAIIIKSILACVVFFAVSAQAETQEARTQLPQSAIEEIAPLFQPTAALGDREKEVFVDKAITLGQRTKKGLFPVFFADEAEAEEPIGYVFYSGDFIRVGGFSGSPINALIAVDNLGHFLGISLPEHNEPIFLHGLGVQSLLDFLNQYSGKRFTNPLFLAPPNSPTASIHQIDAVARATASTIAINKAVTLSALRALSEQFGIEYSSERGEVKQGHFEELTYEQLLEKGYISQITINSSQFVSDVEATNNRVFHIDEHTDAYIAVYVALVTVPTIGKNLLGAEDFARLQQELTVGQQAILVFSRGVYHFFDDDFVRGTEPDFLTMSQNTLPVAIRDMDFYDLDEPKTAALQAVTGRMKLFSIDVLSAFDPSKPFIMEFTVKNKNDPWNSDDLTTYDVTAQLPQAFFTIKKIISTQTAVWKDIWYSKRFIIAVLIAYLAFVGFLFFTQHEYVKRFNIKRVRFFVGIFVIGFVGLYAQGQLSIVNIFPVMQQFVHGFDVEIFLFDPIVFILWAFTFITLFVWGRGVFCGWLCPFGFIQEILFEIGRFFGVKQIKISEDVHKRLWMVKYIILVSLCFTALISVHQAERWSQVEPFKTVITSYFITEWYFVVYAALLLFAGLFIHKFFCRYLCPLGACLSILGKLRQAEWLSRRIECGTCKLCAHKCDIRAIEHSGRINYDECIQCFACVDIYHNDCAVTTSQQKQGIPLKSLPSY